MEIEGRPEWVEFTNRTAGWTIRIDLPQGEGGRDVKLLAWAPRLNRGQKIIRNILLTAVILTILWGVKDFPVLTVQLAPRWAAAACGPPEPSEAKIEQKGEIADEN